MTVAVLVGVGHVHAVEVDLPCLDLGPDLVDEAGCIRSTSGANQGLAVDMDPNMDRLGLVAGHTTDHMSLADMNFEEGEVEERHRQRLVALDNTTEVLRSTVAQAEDMMVDTGSHRTSLAGHMSVEAAEEDTQAVHIVRKQDREPGDGVDSFAHMLLVEDSPAGMLDRADIVVVPGVLGNILLDVAAEEAALKGHRW